MKTIIALVLGTFTCGCATNVKFNNGSAQDIRIAQITAEEGARIERRNAEHLRIVRETEQEIQRQILQAKECQR